MMKKIILPSLVVLSLAASSFAAEEVKPEIPVENSAVAAVTPENEIPLKIEQASVAQATTTQSGKLFLTMFVLAGMAGAGYYFMRKYSFSNKINKSNMQIKVLSQHHLGAKKSLAIIRVAGESILIGVTDQNISMIKSLSLIDDEVPAEAPQSFTQVMAGADADENQTISEHVAEAEDDFSFAGIKTNVSEKLKSMRNFQ